MTKQCKNPECKKELPTDSLNYCNEDCLRRHQQLKKEAKKVIYYDENETATQYMKRRNKEKESGIADIHSQIIKYDAETIHEVEEICLIFGFKHTDGNVVGTHNATILSFLRQEREGVYSTMVDKLTWLCHTSNRNIRENFLKGIEAFGIIQTYTNDFGVLKWRWVGIKALRNNGESKE